VAISDGVGFLLKLIPGGNKARFAVGVALLVAIAWAVHAVFGVIHRYNSGSFTTGTVDLALNTQNEEDQYTALNLNGMMPGGDVYLGLSVVNTGAGGFRYSMSAAPSGDGTLDKDLRISIAAVPASGCGSSAFTAGTSVLRETAGLSRAAISGRSLAGNTTEYLCFHVRLPFGVPNSLGGKSAQATFNFTAQELAVTRAARTSRAAERGRDARSDR